MSVLNLSFFIFLLIGELACFWPPPHEIHLEDSGDFLISEVFEENDDLISDEDEMIPVDSSTKNTDKFYKIHKIASFHNKRDLEMKNKSTINQIKFPEYNSDLKEPIPWEAGFVDKDGNFISHDKKKYYYLNEMVKDPNNKKLEEKRENEESETEANYDYKNFKNEYEAEVEKLEKEKDTFNYTNVKEDETVKEAVENVVDFEKPKNCTAEEKKGIGISAIECIVIDLKTARNKNSILNLLEKIFRISLIWFCVYLVIAIPCWCSRGWCCCCCCCKCCKPRLLIEDAKRFYTQNPVGVFHSNNGEKLVYEPTTYEIYSQKKLEKALFNL